MGLKATATAVARVEKEATREAFNRNRETLIRRLADLFQERTGYAAISDGQITLCTGIAQANYTRSERRTDLLFYRFQVDDLVVLLTNDRLAGASNTQCIETTCRECHQTTGVEFHGPYTSGCTTAEEKQEKFEKAIAQVVNKLDTAICPECKAHIPRQCPTCHRGN